MSQKFKSELELQALNNATTDTDKFLVSDGGIVKYRTGTEVLSDLGITLNTASKLQHQVKAEVAINKGQAVYVTSADGTNMIVGLASNASEATSSKTMGLLDATVAINDFANVVTEGLLAGLNTSTANAGDPVWLGTGGNLIYGLINKPYAPAHLVFIGIVTRVNTNNGEIFVKVQNGFELNEIHDIDLKTTTPINGHILGFDGTLWVNKTIAGWLGYTPANASGTTNYLSKFTGTTSLGNSQIYDNGTNVGIGTSSPISNSILTLGNDASGSATVKLAFSTSAAERGSISMTGSNGEMRLTSGYSGFGGFTTFYNNGSEKMRITSDGNIGIGTSAPTSKLTVDDSTAFSWGFPSLASAKIGTSGTGGSFIVMTPSLNSSYESGFAVDGTYSSGKSVINLSAFGVYSGGPYSADIAFKTATNTTLSEKMRITNSGNVGIGTSSPNSRLEVREANRVFDGYGNVNVFTTDTGTQNVGGSIALGGDSFGGTTPYPFAKIQGIKEGGGTWSGSLILGTTQSNSAITEKMRITSAGNVGIGTTSPVSKLHIGGVGSAIAFDTTGAAGTSIIQTVQDYELSIKNNRGVSSEVIVGNNELKFYTNTAERMRITSSGNVGMGTTSPSEKLSVVGGNISLGAGYKLQYSSTAYMTPENNVSGAEIATGGILTIKTGGTTERVRVDASGNVGIGTTSPGSLLEIKSADPNLTINQTTNSNNSGIKFQSGGNPIGSITSQGSNGNMNINMGPSAAWGGYITFQTDTSERMRITSTGNVGIGTTSPAYKLDVSGTARLNGELVLPTNGILQHGTAWNTGTFTLQNGPTEYFKFDVPNNRVDNRLGKYYVGGTNALFGTYEAYDTLFVTNNSEKMRITSGGNVGIGTSSPSQKLTVNGSIAATTGGNIILYTPSNDDFTNIYYDSSYALNLSSSSGIVKLYGYNGVSINTYTTPNAVTVLQNGNVGIGTTSPISKLQSTGDITVGAGTFSGSGTMQLLTGGASPISNRITYSTDGTGWKFAIGKNQSGTVTDQFVIQDNGNVGIGTTSPINNSGYGGLTLNGSSGAILSMLQGGSETFRVTNATGYSFINTTGATPLLLGTNGNERMRITSTGNVGIGTTSPSALLDVNGDALINGLTVGRGPGNSAFNTALGVAALNSNTSGEYNIAIGRSANYAVNISGSTVIGADLFTNPGNNSLASNCLAISQYNPNNAGTQYPHIYAPDKVNCPNGNTTTDIIAVDYSIYTAIFMEYSIFNSAGDQFRAGTYTAAFKGSGTVVDDDNQTVVYSGTTLSATFTTSISGSVATIQLRNQDSDTYDIRVTARLLMR